MIRPLSVLASAILAAGSLSAQDSVPTSPGPTLVASIPAPTVLSGFPQTWRDSVVGAWNRFAGAARLRTIGDVSPGAFGELTLQLLRNGDLRRVRLRTSTGDRALDSLLLAITRDADEALAFPPFPRGVEGAGTEVTLQVRVPLPERLGMPFADSAGGRASVRMVQVRSEARACDTVLARPTGYSATALWSWVDSTRGGPEGPEWARRALTSMQSEFVPPTRADPAIPPAVIRESHILEVTLAATRGRARVAVAPTGRLGAVELVASSGYPAIDTALRRMFQRADSLGLIPPPPGTTDSTVIDISIQPGRTAPRGAVPLGRVNLADWLADVPPSMTHPAMPRYPQALKEQGKRGRVELAFVVDRNGIPVPNSLQIISSPHPDFSRAATDAVLASRFKPGEIRGCPIPVMVRQAVNFNQ